MSIYEKYETVIGLEIHVQLATQSKAFCGDDARFGGAPNTHISAISLGHPGTLPRLNKRQVEFAVKLGLALGSQINLHNTFDRKNYFYADLPKGYQITQDRQPVCVGGTIAIPTPTGSKSIRIHHLHMEEDAGKSIHDMEPGHTLVDLNRAGVPLLEVVTEPDLRGPEEVDALMSAMRQLVRYLEISDGNMEEGSLRCDCNVSVCLKGTEKLGERCEVKNLNSMRFARRAIEFERKRQIDLLEAGGQVRQQTLNFDPATGITSPLRDKEDAHDYRYFPEPDLPPVILSEAYLEKLEKQMPPLPWALRQAFEEDYQLSAYDAELLTQEKARALYFQSLVKASSNYKAAANLLINKILPYVQEQKINLSEFPITTQALSEFIQLIIDDKVSTTMAYQRLFPALLQEPEQSPLAIAEKEQLIQSQDTDFMDQLISDILAQNPDKVKAYQNGKKNLLGFFMGQLMRQSKGRANPKKAEGLLKKALEIVG